MSDQGDDWLWGEPAQRRYVEFLPACQTCSNDVKPGEDYCWSCLGEVMEEEPEFELRTYYSQKLLNILVPALLGTT